MDGLKVGEVAKLAGVNLQTIHYYERRGLLPKPPRTGSNYRAYPTDAVLLVRFIKHAQELGFTLNEIKELSALRDGRSRRRSEVRAAAETKLRDIDQKLARLQAMRSALSSLIESCACGRGRLACPILEALDDPSNPLSEDRSNAKGGDHVRD
jgi:Cu(I)-responsive transcriptional regulator